MRKNLINLLIYTLFILLITFITLHSENNMELIAELTGEHALSKFGFQMASLDFNGDGIEDLAVGAQHWDSDYLGWPENPIGNTGKIYMYFGPIINECTPDFTMSVNDSIYNLGYYLTDLGDMNGDGFDDLGYFSDEVVNNNGTKFNHILLGNNVLDSIPDYTFSFPDSIWLGFPHEPKISSIGDINGDGYDDATILITKYWNYIDPCSDYVFIIYGNQFELSYFRKMDNSINLALINSVNDTNNDNLDDFIINYEFDNIVYKDFYYGNTILDSIPSLTIKDTINPYSSVSGGIAIGDWNGDGIYDFNGGINHLGGDIWLGSINLPFQQMYLEIDEILIQRNTDYGDINGDGKSDFIQGNSGSMTGMDGKVNVFLGGQNGTRDYVKSGHCGVNLGWCITVADFNNDGFDDIAVSGHGEGGWYTESTFCGKVYIYAGNSELAEADPDVELETEEITSSTVQFKAYPNPFNPTISFDIKLSNKYEELELKIFNAKGQRIDTLSKLTPECTIEWEPTDYTSGVYFCKLVSKNEILSVKKVTLLK